MEKRLVLKKFDKSIKRSLGGLSSFLALHMGKNDSRCEWRKMMSQEQQTKKSESWEWIKAILIAVILMFIIRQFIFAPVVVDGESMFPTLEDRDRMIVSKINYRFGEPKRFDIIVFHAPSGKDYIKRVIGLPGDKVEYRNDTLYINGEEIKEPYLDELKVMYGGAVTNDFIADEIPEDHVFVLGDNRPESRDSRSIGPVPFEEIVGKTNIVFWPLRNIQIVK